MVLIAVHGSSSVRVPAERGTVHLSVESEHEDRATVVERVAALHERLSREAQAFVDAGTATRWSSDQVQVRAEHRYEGAPETRRLVQLAAAQLQVRFSDLEALSSWVQDVGSEPGVVVQGIDWSVVRSTREEAERATRVAAVRDAMQRAGAYASAVGGGEPVLTAVWEDGLRPSSGRPDLGWVAQSTSRLDGPPALVLRPDAIDIAVAVTADFELGGVDPHRPVRSTE